MVLIVAMQKFDAVARFLFIESQRYGSVQFHVFPNNKINWFCWFFEVAKRAHDIYQSGRVFAERAMPDDSVILGAVVGVHLVIVFVQHPDRSRPFRPIHAGQVAFGKRIRDILVQLGPVERNDSIVCPQRIGGTAPIRVIRQTIVVYAPTGGNGFGLRRPQRNGVSNRGTVFKQLDGSDSVPLPWIGAGDLIGGGYLASNRGIGLYQNGNSLVGPHVGQVKVRRSVPLRKRWIVYAQKQVSGNRRCGDGEKNGIRDADGVRDQNPVPVPECRHNVSACRISLQQINIDREQHRVGLAAVGGNRQWGWRRDCRSRLGLAAFNVQRQQLIALRVIEEPAAAGSVHDLIGWGDGHANRFPVNSGFDGINR